MTWEVYPQYKPASGMNWPDQIPEHWEIKKLSHLAILRSGENITAEQIDEVGPYPVYGGNGQRGFCSRYTHDGEFVLIGRQGALCGNINYARGKFWASEHAIVVRPLQPFVTRWLGELLRAMNLNQYSVSAAQPGLSVATVSALRVPVPPAEEQRAIADFLDRETSRVDELLTRQRQLLEKLNEKESAQIARAVTKGLPPEYARMVGLDPNPKMKKTGVDWLGLVPVHWSVMQLKRAIQFQRGHDLSADTRQAGGVPVVSSAGVIGTHSVAAARGPGIVTGRYGSVGNFHFVETDYWPLNTTLYSTSFRGNEPRFLVRMLQNLAPLFLLNAVKSAVPGVDRNDIHPVLTAVPPVPEQKLIADYLDSEVSKLQAIRAEVEQATERIQDYRAALITAAVTGQIDVRNFRPQGAAAVCR